MVAELSHCRTSEALLETIHLPSNFNHIDRLLPSPNYEEEFDLTMISQTKTIDTTSTSTASVLKDCSLNLPKISMKDKVTHRRHLTPTLVRDSYRERLSHSPITEIKRPDASHLTRPHGQSKLKLLQERYRDSYKTRRIRLSK
jgi:hypothetical protein